MRHARDSRLIRKHIKIVEHHQNMVATRERRKREDFTDASRLGGEN